MKVDYNDDGSMSFIHNVVEFGLGLASEGSSIVASVDKSMEPSSRMIERIVVMGTPLSPSAVVMDINGKETSLEFEFGSSSNVLIIRKPNLSALENWNISIYFG
mmetsp:Transcript_31998/g.47755  ORF Transcript_31998/g.47755 Transcript_31998/m.47755 type:complete len:104 (-) Transcript_31998:112-423(-)